MLSNYLTSSYLQYKQDTNTVAAWLATTARKCGYPVDLLIKHSNGQQQQKPASGRLKGKARKLERQAANKPAASGPSSPKKPTYIIAVKNFIDLAQLIASHQKPPVRVPESFVNAITRAISVRRSHGQAVPHRDEKSDERHGYFIGVLEHVYKVLKPRMPSGAVETGDLAAAEANSFEGLEVQQPPEQLHALSISANPTQPAEDNYEAEQLQDLEEVFLAFQLLIQDYNTFRDVIMETWGGYRQGIFDLVSASLTTNTALDLARRLEEDIKPMMDKFGGAEKMLQVYSVSLCTANGENHDFREQPEDGMNFRMYEKLENIYWPVYIFMKPFIDMLDPNSCPEYKPGHYGVYDPSSDRSKKTAREKFQEDKILLAEFLPEVSLLCWGTKHTKPFDEEDEFIRGLRTAFATQKLSLSTIFAGQVFLDIHHTLREGVSRGLADFVNVSQVIDNSIEMTLKFHTSLRVDNWPISNYQAFKNIQQRISYWAKSDPFAEVKQRLGRQAEPFLLMKSHPLFCGLLAYTLKVDFQDLCHAFVGAWGSILYTYQLYNACKQEKLLQDAWKDLDTFMGLQGNGVFVEDEPTSPEDYLKRFLLSIGYSATAFAKNRRKGRLEASKSGPRGGLKELAPVAHMFQDRFCKGSGQIDWTLEDVQKIVSRSEWKEDELADNLLELTLNRTSKQTHKPDADTSSSSSQLSATKLLRSLRNALHGEVLELSMDYLVLHRFCWIFLRHANNVLESDLRRLYGREYLQTESRLPFIVGYVFLAASNAKDTAKILQPPRNRWIVTSKLLVKAAGAMKGFLDGGVGDIMCRVLETKYNIRVADDDEREASGDAMS